MTRYKGFINAALYSLVVAIAFTTLMLLTASPFSTPQFCEAGSLDMTNFDFAASLALIPDDFFNEYNSTLLTPEDFTEELPSQAGNGGADYATYRLVMELPADQVYGIAFGSASYSMRVWVNGKEYESVGWPDETLEGTTPKTQFYTLYFAAADGPNELVIQRAGFHHARHGYLKDMYLGTQQSISRYASGVQMRINIIVGTMLMSSLFFFGLFLSFRERRQFLWFSLACLMVLFRTLTVEYKLVRVLLPDISWFVSMGIEYLSFIGLVVSLVLYLHCMFHNGFPRWSVQTLVSFSLVYAVVILITKPLFYTRFIIPFQVAAGLFGVFFILCIINGMGRDRRSRHPEHLLCICGFAAFVGLGIPDIFLHQLGFRSHPVNLTQLGMMLCVFANMLALVMSFSRTEQELHTVRESGREICETNRMLERLNRAKTDFLGNISHEMKTPLTVISSCAGTTLIQLDHNSFDDSTRRNLDGIQQEAVRLGRLVEQLMAVAVEKERQLTLTDTHAEVLLSRAAAFCEPICRGHQNQITVECRPAHIPLRVNTDAIFQVLLNLIANANRQAHNQVIVILAREGENNTVVFEVTDSGKGIPPALLPHVFERGVSGNGGTGLGLAICKEIVQEHGGSMTIQSDGGGTTVRFTLPVGKAHPYEEQRKDFND